MITTRVASMINHTRITARTRVIAISLWLLQKSFDSPKTTNAILGGLGRRRLDYYALLLCLHAL